MLRILLGIALLAGPVSRADSFRFHLLTEPHTMDPQSVAANSGNYVFQNIYHGLFRYHSRRGLILEGAKNCVREKLALTCHLNPKHRWSNGERITAADYLRSFRRLIDPQNRSPQVELILTLKNAGAIWAGKMPPDQLGIRAVNEETLRFDFAKEDPEFEFKLINAALSPWPPSGLLTPEKSPEMITSGPYKIESWKPGHMVKLVANKNYGLPANAKRPDLEAFFLDNDATALRLYEAGKINFLRRLTAGEIPRFRDSKDFVQRPFARLEYIGFGPQLLSHPDLREALSLSLDFSAFQKLFDTRTPLGCPGVPAGFLDRSTCLKFSPEKAKALLAKEKDLPKLEFHFSRMGGEDLSRAAEWFQAQWKKNLNLTVELKAEEQLVYLGMLRSNPPPIFRKGVGLDRPTCLAAMELFAKENPENYIHFDDPRFEKLLQDLRLQKSARGRKISCRKASEYLIDSHRILPLGEMYFTLLVSPKFSGWDLNELNYLDLTDLSEGVL